MVPFLFTPPASSPPTLSWPNNSTYSNLHFVPLYLKKICCCFSAWNSFNLDLHMAESFLSFGFGLNGHLLKRPLAPLDNVRSPNYAITFLTSFFLVIIILWNFIYRFRFAYLSLAFPQVELQLYWDKDHVYLACCSFLSGWEELSSHQGIHSPSLPGKAGATGKVTVGSSIWYK